MKFWAQLFIFEVIVSETNFGKFQRERRTGKEESASLCLHLIPVMRTIYISLKVLLQLKYIMYICFSCK
jgi:hypothetical protein